ncbi:glycosyltransferase family 2 protein [Yoonia sp. GPGPB17]|uniref:glycosyltransferase family 2 protein n=1 Tax=Yoonia sp. GPGPB17 TaxID=3026147 RepID=UPI0030C38B38
MAKDDTTWAVVATVDEPPALVQAFVAWHLSLGAAQVFIYCDRPDDPVRDMLAHLTAVTVVPCDEAHWLRVGRSRPRRHEVRQVRNARDAYARTKADWILHCDADEFIWAGRSASSALGDVSEEVECLAVPVAERLGVPDESIFDGAFRRPFREPTKTGRQLFGPDYDLTYRGLTGHSQGKGFVRCGRSLQMSIHRPRPLQIDGEVVVARADVNALELLHFEGLTPVQWTFKLSRMVHALAEMDGMPPSKHRRRQADALIADPNDRLGLYQRLKCPDDATVALLKRFDLWADPPFDPTAAIQHYFPDQAVDLTPQAIDAWLRRKKARVLSFLHSD